VQDGGGREREVIVKAMGDLAEESGAAGDGLNEECRMKTLT